MMEGLEINLKIIGATAGAKSRRGTSDDGTTVTAAHLWNLLISYEIRANHIYLPFDLRDKRNRSAINTEWNKILRLFTLSVNISIWTSRLTDWLDLSPDSYNSCNSRNR